MNDLKFAFRQLLKSPGFAAIAVLTLALGIGVNTSMFSAMLALINRDLPFPSPSSLVQVFHSSPGSPRESHHSAPDFLDFRESRTFEYLAAFNDRQSSLVEPGRPAERIQGLEVSADFFPLLGVPPELGRVFTAEEEQRGSSGVVILDHNFWQRKFQGDTNIIGHVLRLDGEAVTVIGVMPEKFRDVMLMGQVNLWRPITFTEQQRRERENYYLKCIARIKHGTSLPQAQSAANLLTSRHSQGHPDSGAEQLLLVPLAKSSLPPQARNIVWAIMALAGFVLLIACANLANLQFARTAARGREFAVRGALGAPRGRLIRQLLTENLLLAAIGGGLGLMFALWSNDILKRQFMSDGETLLNLSLNLRVMLFALGAAFASAIASGLMPAWLAAQTDVNEALKQGARGTLGNHSQHRIQHALIIAEVSLALMLLAGASLVTNGIRKYATINPGWDVGEVTLGYLNLPDAKYGNDDALRSFASRLEEKLSSSPGVKAAALCWNLPLRQFNVTSGFGIEGRPEPPKGTVQNCSVNGVTQDYFKTLGMRLLMGRNFSATDDSKHPAVIIINQRMAQTFWPGGSPLGGKLNGAEIVGVVNDVSFPANPAQPATLYQTYRPYAQETRPFINIAVRGMMAANSLRRLVADIDQDQPVGKAGPAAAEVGSSLNNWGVGGKLLSTFALMGLSLAILGIYGVISGFVVRRTSEIGLRMAMGARVKDVLWFVIKQGFRLTLIGIVIGLVGAFGLARLLASFLPQLPAANAVLVIFVAAFLLTIALLACWLPARRAARVDPMMALRQE